MGTKGIKGIEARQFKDALLGEIFAAYQESGMVYQKTTDPETRQTVLDMKRCYDLVIHHLSPLDAQAEQLREELGTRFSA